MVHVHCCTIHIVDKLLYTASPCFIFIMQSNQYRWSSWWLANCSTSAGSLCNTAIFLQLTYSTACYHKVCLHIITPHVAYSYTYNVQATTHTCICTCTCHHNRFSMCIEHISLCLKDAYMVNTLFPYTRYVKIKEAIKLDLLL